MKESKAEKLLKKHLAKKNITPKNMHVAAYMSCLDAIEEALECSASLYDCRKCKYFSREYDKMCNNCTGQLFELKV